MPRSAFMQNLREVWEVPRDLLLGRYPSFVHGGELRTGQIPVFVFHSVEPVAFSRRLDFLAANRYRTLTADEYLSVIEGRLPTPERAVVLSFDDGRGSLWSVAAPLLRRHGMRGVVFLVPGRMVARGGPPLPTWDDALAGRAAEAEVVRREDVSPFLFWEEARELGRDGIFDFQSHTLRHARIAVSPRLDGFVTPWSRRGYQAMDLPLVREGQRELIGEELPLGAPVLRSAPRMADVLRFFEGPEVRKLTSRIVAEGGGRAFFDRSGWQRELRRLTRGMPVEGRLETEAEREAALREELAGAASLLEERLERPVRHLCYPWHASSPTARALALEAGYRSAFCGKVAGTPLTEIGGDPYSIARVSEDFLECLPGDGRVRLSVVLWRKWLRRLTAYGVVR